MTGALAGQEEADAQPASTAPSGHSCAGKRPTRERASRAQPGELRASEQAMVAAHKLVQAKVARVVRKSKINQEAFALRQLAKGVSR